jgi:hypothetical protein
MDISCIADPPCEQWIKKSLRETPQAFHTKTGFGISVFLLVLQQAWLRQQELLQELWQSWEPGQASVPQQQEQVQELLLFSCNQQRIQ